MKFLDSQWERIRFSLTPTQLRLGLALLSIVALVLGGSADDSWTDCAVVDSQCAEGAMLGLLIPVVVISVVGALWVGSLAGLQRLRILWWQLAFGSMAVELVLHNPPVNQQPWAMAWGPWIWVACLGAMLTVLVRNGLSNDPSRGAFRLAAVGVAVNLFVVLANGGFMPQSAEARLSARGIPLVTPGSPPQLRNVVVSGPETRFAWLSDVIAQPSWLPTANVVSIGDLVLSTALALWAFQSITAKRRTQVWSQTADSR